MTDSSLKAGGLSISHITIERSMRKMRDLQKSIHLTYRTPMHDDELRMLDDTPVAASMASSWSGEHLGCRFPTQVAEGDRSTCAAPGFSSKWPTCFSHHRGGSAGLSWQLAFYAVTSNFLHKRRRTMGSSSSAVIERRVGPARIAKPRTKPPFGRLLR